MNSPVLASVESFVTSSCYYIIFSITFPLLVLFFIDITTYVYQLCLGSIGDMLLLKSKEQEQSSIYYIDKNHQVTLIYNSLQGIEIKSISYWNYLLRLFSSKVEVPSISEENSMHPESNTLSPKPSNTTAGQKLSTVEQYFNRMWFEKLRKSE